MKTTPKMQGMNKRGAMGTTILIILAIAVVGAAGFYGFTQWNSGGDSDVEGDSVWTSTNIYKTVSIKDKYTAAAMNVSLEIFEKKPASCWDDLTEDDCDEDVETSASVVDGSVTIKDLTPGTYYVVARADGYYPEFFELVIRSEGRTESETPADYNEAPETTSVTMKKVGTLSMTNSTMTFSATEDSKEKTDFVYYQVNADACFVLGKVVVTESENSLSEYDGEELSYEGIETFKIKVGDEWVEVISAGEYEDFDTDTTGQKTTFDLSDENIEICDEGLLSVNYYVKADVNVSADTLNDMLLSNETIATISFKDILGNAQSDVVLNAAH